jgi:hypothetical protein
MTTTPTDYPDVPLPAGADFGDIWKSDEPERVVIGGESRHHRLGPDRLDVGDPSSRTAGSHLSTPSRRKLHTESPARRTPQ